MEAGPAVDRTCRSPRPPECERPGSLRDMGAQAGALWSVSTHRQAPRSSADRMLAAQSPGGSEMPRPGRAAHGEATVRAGAGACQGSWPCSVWRPTSCSGLTFHWEGENLLERKPFWRRRPRSGTKLRSRSRRLYIDDARLLGNKDLVGQLARVTQLPGTLGDERAGAAEHGGLQAQPSAGSAEGGPRHGSHRDRGSPA